MKRSNTVTREIVGIVGSSKLGYDVGHSFITKLISSLPEDTVIVTGDALGVDLLVRNVCMELQRTHSTIFSKENNFKNGYKNRNKIIADYCDRVISIALPFSKIKCYHCVENNNHEKTGGCYTGKMNGNYEVMVFE